MGSPLILVVGQDPYKGTIASLLRRQNYEVKETTDIDCRPNETLLDARRWISRNSLRRLNGQSVKVIFAVGQCSHPKEWVDVVGLTFKPYSDSVAAAVQSNDSVEAATRLRETFNLGSGRSIVVSPALSLRENGSLREMMEGLEQFKIKSEAISSNSGTSAWSSEKVILFGRTGAGKSTVAQMLTLGRLDPSSNAIFEASNSAKGVTHEIQRGEGRGWHVTDTPGFGETKEGTVSTKHATEILKKFVISTCGTYSHYIYVVKKDRINQYDTRLWTFFTKVFKNAEENFSVVVTGCTEKLTDEDNEYLRDTFTGCKNIIHVDFCPLVEGDQDPELEKEDQEVREESLKELEEGLARLRVAEKECYEGQFSKESIKFYHSDLRSAIYDCKGTIPDAIVSATHYLLMKPIAKVAGFFQKSEIDERFILLPQ